jgi:FHA domain
MVRARDLLSGLERAEFAAGRARLFLVKAPSASAFVAAESGGSLSFRTAQMSEDALIDAATFSGQWWIGEIRKRAGNPFPDRISIGRAPNCDLVLRVSFVSKLHAHVLVGGGELRLSDNRSANGTWLDGRELLPGVSAVIGEGSRIRFGAVNLAVMAVGPLHDLLAMHEDAVVLGPG